MASEPLPLFRLAGRCGPWASGRHSCFRARVRSPSRGRRRNSLGACSLPMAGYRLGSERGSPNHGSTLASKRVMPQIRSPARVSTQKPVAWPMPAGPRR